MLQQNYPNSFNSRTTIQFSVQKSMNVNLTIYDMQGQEIAVLYDGTCGCSIAHPPRTAPEFWMKFQIYFFSAI